MTRLFNHDAYWQQIGTLTRTNPSTSLIKEPLMRIVHRVIVGSLVHRAGSKERCQKRDLWLISMLDESRGINLAWVKHASGLKENSLICRGPIIRSSGYEIGGSSRGVHGDDDEDDISDQYVRSENCVASEDDDMQD
ncbi:hypothetical protein Tco_1077755 [Tanacetum coccineum]